TKNGVKYIKDIKIGDYVLTHTGKFKKVNKIFQRKYNGRCFKIKASNINETVDITENHEILVLKKPKPSLFKKIDSSKKEWIKSQDLNKEYFLLFPISEFGDNIINNDLCRLIGYYAAEGCIMYEGRKENRKFKGIQFAFHKEEDDFINDVNNIIKNLYGLDSKIKKFKDTNQCVIRIFSQKIAEDMNNFVPGLAGTKKLHSILMSLNKECTKHLLSGFIRGD